ncbi:MAG: cytochrome c maturation protein CcmE [Proteobacteria bacterium]|nr:cytochrome c maturation protein CcmE [Pseudomonadota bacterium]
MNPVRKRRLIAAALILASVAAATALTVFALQQNMTYLYSPSEVEAGKSPISTPFRLGGVVREGSIRRVSGTLQTDFTVTDRFHDLRVQYTGILPDLFREGQSVIATGHMSGGHFTATEVLAKHDETYMPKEVADAIAKAKAAHREAGSSEQGAGSRGKTDGVPDLSPPTQKKSGPGQAPGPARSSLPPASSPLPAPPQK